MTRLSSCRWMPNLLQSSSIRWMEYLALCFLHTDFDAHCKFKEIDSSSNHVCLYAPHLMQIFWLCRLAQSLVGEADRGSTLGGTVQLWPSIHHESRKTHLLCGQRPRHGFMRTSASSGEAQFTEGSGSAQFSATEDSPGMAAPVQWATRFVF